MGTKPKKHPHHNKYVIDLGAATPPALPEKELSELRGFNQGKVVVWVVTIIATLCLIFRPEVDRFVERLLGFEPEQPAFTVTVWANENRLDNTCPEHDDCDELPVHIVPAGAEMRILIEGTAEVEKFEYLFPTMSMETHTIEGNEGSFILPELPANLMTLLRIQIYDADGHVQAVEYTLGRLEQKGGA